MIDWIERKVQETKKEAEYHKKNGESKKAEAAEREHYNYRAMLNDVKTRLAGNQSSTV